MTMEERTCSYLIEKIYKDKANLILEFAEYLKVGTPLFSRFNNLNNELKLLSKIESYQLRCYEPLHWVEGFNEAYTDSFEGWSLVPKDKEIDLYKVGLLGADDLVFELENI